MPQERNKKNESGKGVADFPKYEENPFLESMVISTRKKTVEVSRGAIPVHFANRKVGDVEETFIHVKREVDTQEFRKLYTDSIKQLFGLNNAAMSVFGYIMEATRINQDKVFFSMNECMKYTGYTTRQSIYRGIAQLLSRKIIARTNENNIYFINISIFSNGDRLVIIRDYIARKGVSSVTGKAESLTLNKNNVSPEEISSNSESGE